MSIQQRVLYPLGFLHQTTTSTRRDRNHIPLYHIWILHQTTTHNLFKLLRTLLYHIWILHQTTTFLLLYFCLFMLYHIWILHQTTTTVLRYPNYICCIIFGFYIKPQHIENAAKISNVVSYLDSTSNHNRKELGQFGVWLYHIWILHQTTTRFAGAFLDHLLYHIWILHQTTTRGR